METLIVVALVVVAGVTLVVKAIGSNRRRVGSHGSSSCSVCSGSCCTPGQDLVRVRRLPRGASDV